jgi:hypothetical protein
MIQIVPALPPATNGVGDYALAVARVMRSELGLDTLFVVGNPAWLGPEEVEGFAVRKVTARTAQRLEEALDGAQSAAGESRVLLQLSIYGYSRRGCPWWLMQGLKRWRARQTDGRLVTMFHELYAPTGVPWKSTFWVVPVQRMVVTGIARRSDIALTNIRRHRECLERLDPSKRGRIANLAVPSNVGEPLEPGELGSRAKSMVVFGLPGSRKRTYETRLAALQRVCEEMGIAEIHDVGAGFDGIPERVGSVPVRKHEVLNISDLSSLLSSAMVGFLDYFPLYLAKSGVFAAYCAHRMIPVTGEDERSEADGIECGVHYHCVEGKQEAMLQDTQSIADAAWNWYRGHSLQCHARAFAEALLTDAVSKKGDCFSCPSQ